MSQQPPASNNGERGKPPRRNWSDVVEELLEEAHERGDFDNLKGKGERIPLDRWEYAGDRALAYSVLKNNNIAPPEIERGKEIDAELRQADALLANLRRNQHAMRGRLRVSPSERRAYNVLRDKAEARYEAALRGINSKILSLNIIAPSALHRKRVPVDERMAAFREEFPRLEE